MKIYTKVIVPRLYDYKEYTTMRAWCKENFGASNNKKDKELGYLNPWYAKDWHNDGSAFVSASHFCFRNPAHATLFALRWI